MILRSEKGLSEAEITNALISSLPTPLPDRILLLPPDYTRMYSGGGMIASIYYDYLTSHGRSVDVMPALGTHAPMTEDEVKAFFRGSVPMEKIIVHRWRDDVVKIGVVPGEFVSSVSEGLIDTPIDVEVNKRIVSGEYGLIISMGQVVPHEVVGMANYSKNIFVGCGGSSMINSSHMLGAFYGLERIMGRDFSPVRQVFDYAEEHFIRNVPLLYVLTTTTNKGDEVSVHGLYTGRSRANFEAAVADAQKYNLIHMDEPIKKCVVYLDPREFKSTWLGNKAVYRTRMAIADGGELIVLAPGVVKFGEDDENDRLIRKYGYVGREKVLELVKQPENEDLRANMSVAAHLIHGSSDGRFSVTYCTRPENCSEAEVRGAAFGWVDYDTMAARYDPSKLTDGWNDVGGERIFYISNPALGLWDAKK
ncbi:MAG: lactate racemase domain-containing protein [Clostridiales bacterium]|nr:lactate racemase domain-containing protein [Clostridiales bacterium]